MDDLKNSTLVCELHDDLARKYKTHGATIESLWRSFDKNQRARCLVVGAADGVVLKHSLDASMGNVHKIVPEWNRRDITERGPDFFLDLLRHRATQSLVHQYSHGVKDAPGDHALIDNMMRTRGLRTIDDYKDCYTFFTDGNYGESFKVMDESALAGFAPAIRAGLCVKQSAGELILQRQIVLLQSLNIIIDDILDEGSRTRDRKQRPSKTDKAATAALSKLTIHSSPPKLALSDLVASARDQQDSLHEYLGLLSTEPTVLAHAVNSFFFSRPEFVADEKGRRLPVHTDRYISSAVVEAINFAFQGAAIWKYIVHLLELLQSPTTDKHYRAIVLQEISNICHLEYSRVQALFRRHVQAATGSKWFKRASNVYDKAGNARVTLKGNPEELTQADPQLHYILRLCQPETTPVKAVDWIKKLSGLHQAHPLEREKLQERETDLLCDLAVIIAFIQDLSSVVAMPPLSRKKGQAYVDRSQQLEAELNQLKTQIDLRDFAVPIDNLLEPGMSEKALTALDQFIVEKAGTNMGFLYQDLVEDCLLHLQHQHQQAKAKIEQMSNVELPSFPASTPEPPEKKAEQRRQKEKTRPPHSSIYEMGPRAETSAAGEVVPPSQTFKVSSSTAGVFSTLFTRSQSRGSVSWEAFVVAMVELGFSFLPKFGSVYTFTPPDTMAVKRPLTVHRPHESRIEGHRALILSRRLQRVYGWGEQTFHVS